ncbi:hypothetical protein [Winogradskyella vincentii]|uniref:Uncharacterized protein n=1 Tax=Winogradskyella vincentii TaxID=2877122 RepID=A0ABS7Y122_9FLAO|nr:hypothetical protein [Winogradskyella vincentii]MCA0153625.1 hypothetical protein [Winogradskyella vincentii]
MSNTIDSSEWKSKPDDNLWNSKANWKSDKIPNKTAIFSKSCKTLVGFKKNSNATINQIKFTKKAPSFNFNIKVYKKRPALTIDGKGVINNSKRQQCFSVTSKGVGRKTPQLKFTNSASAGNFNMLYYAGPKSLNKSYGGGVIAFFDKSTAGSAFFTIRTGKQAPPKENSTVGAEVTFCDSSNAGKARFTVFGTLGSDGDTFGNAVFHDKASAEQAVFTNIGGTVSGGDGGNTQFYDETTAAFGTYDNYGGNVKKANGGDVAFDGIASAGNALFYNRAAKVDGAYGGVTSFNNNPNIFSNNPIIKTEKGATAGVATFHNYGASGNNLGGGGHTEFTAKYATCTAGNGNFHNYGSITNVRSSAGHTIFSISKPTKNYPSAGNGTFWNYPSPIKNGVGGFTEFSMYNEGDYIEPPTAEKATFINLGATVNGANGGYTSFSNETTAAEATLIAHGGINGGNGGQILFNDNSTGDNSSVELIGNGELDLSYHKGPLTIKNLILKGGLIKIRIGDNPTTLNIAKDFNLNTPVAEFSFYLDKENGFKYDTAYAILSANNLSDSQIQDFRGNEINGHKPKFSVSNNILFVSYSDKN